ERLLVTRRSEGTHLAGYWEFPGGKLAPGEAPEACAVREVFEETAVTARALRRRPAIGWDYPTRAVLLYPIDCEWLSGEGEPREVAELRWASPNDLPHLQFPEANAALIAELVAGSELTPRR
ncbi:MAG TPA: (deoxy)nucleoside triphosphate pyrophosphohydrolase, partial [Polyangiaceae bacterium]